MDKYKVTDPTRREIGNLVEITTRFRLNTKKNRQLDVKHMREILEIVEAGIPENAKVMVRGLNGHRFFTFKTYNTDLKVLDFDEYYRNKVEDTGKFEKFEYIEITVVRERSELEMKNKTNKKKKVKKKLKD